MKQFLALAAALLIATFPIASNAQGDSDDPGEVDRLHPEIPDIDEDGRPGLIPLQAFASRSQLGSASLSPDGTKFAFAHTADGSNLITVFDVNAFETIRSIQLHESQSLNWFRWAGSNRLLMSYSRRAFVFFFPVSMSRLQLFDLQDDELRQVALEEQGLEGDDVLHIDPSGEFIILSASREIFEEPDVWRFPLDREGSERIERIQKRKGKIDEWWADDAGVVRLGMGFTSGGATIIYYRSGPDEDFERVTKLKHDSEERDNWDVMGIFEGSDMGFALSKADNGRLALRRFDYSSGTPGEVLHSVPDWDLDSVYFDRQGLPVGVQYIDDEERTVWLDSNLATIQRQLEAALGGGVVEIISRAQDDRMLVIHRGSGDPGALYVFTPKAGQLQLFANLRPEVDHRLLARGEGHTITARDGTKIRSYLTLPRGREPRSLPMILMPHGGPYGVRDTLAYDDWVQMLANRGYAVLQPNFRGSSGFGEAFEELGDGEIGRKMQDDLDDAVDWAISHGYADAERVCIFGASYGGYAALWGAIRNPERYRCAVSWAGVTDFDKQLDYSTDYIARRYRKDWKRKVRGESFNLDRVSPVHQIEYLTRPVLVAHGTQDSTVPFSQYEALVEAAAKAGKDIETLELKDGHGFRDKKNELAFFRATMKFLSEHNPADRMDDPADLEPAPSETVSDKFKPINLPISSGGEDKAAELTQSD